MLELGFQIDPASRLPAYRQLARWIRRHVEEGALAPGERLPASRELARALGVSRNTVTLAYELLISEELAHGHVGRGTFVSRPPGFATSGRAEAGRRPPWAELSSGRLERLPEEWWGRREGAPEDAVADFRGGRVDTSMLPGGELRRLHGWALDRLSEVGNHLGAGWRPLRAEIASRLVARGVAASAAEVVVTSGAQQAFDLVARALVAPGDRVAFESPGFPISAAPFLAAGAEPVAVPVDGEGLDVASLRRRLDEAPIKLLLTTPATQCPTGVSMSSRRRAELLELAAERRMVIVEDDYDGELRGPGKLVPALATGDAEGWVIYVGTFSKTVYPALRTGYLVADRELVERLTLARAVADLGPPIVPQVALAEWLASGGYERLLRARRREYGRRLALLGELLAALDAGLEHRPPSGGSALWVRLPAGVDAERLRRDCRERRVAFSEGSGFFWCETMTAGERPASHRRDEGSYLYLNVAACGEDEIRRGVAVLGEALAAQRRGGSLSAGRSPEAANSESRRADARPANPHPSRRRGRAVTAGRRRR